MAQIRRPNTGRRLVEIEVDEMLGDLLDGMKGRGERIGVTSYDCHSSSDYCSTIFGSGGIREVDKQLSITFIAVRGELEKPPRKKRLSTVERGRIMRFSGRGA